MDDRNFNFLELPLTLPVSKHCIPHWPRIAFFLKITYKRRRKETLIQRRTDDIQYVLLMSKRICKKILFFLIFFKLLFFVLLKEMAVQSCLVYR